MSEDLEGLLSGLRFRPRASLGPEIAGRARRGEAPAIAARARFSRRRLLALGAASVVLTASASWLARRAGGPVVRVDQCCRDLDGGAGNDDGFVVEAHGRHIDRITLYEDVDGDGHLGSADRVRLIRGAAPALGPDSVVRVTRVCCADLDGEGAADDGLLVLHGADERVLLAGVFERGRAGAAAALR